MISAELSLEVSKFLSQWDVAVRKVNTGSRSMEQAGETMGDNLLSGMASKLQGGIAGIVGGLTAGAVMAAAREAMEAANEFDMLSDKLNESAESLQRVDYAARMTANLGVKEVSEGMLELEKIMGELDNTGAQDALKRFGINAGEIMAMPLEKKILALSDAFRQARETGSGYADMVMFLSDAGKEMIPLLSQSREELERLLGAAAVVPEDDVARLAKMNDQFDHIVMKSKAWTAEVIASIAGLVDFLNEASKLNDPFEKMGENAQKQGLEDAQKERSRISSAEALSKAQAEAAAAAETKKAADEKAKPDKAREDALKRVGAAEDRMAKQQRDQLSDADKLTALNEEQRKIFESMAGMGGSFFSADMSGMEAWIDKIKEIGDVELLEKVVGMLERAKGLQTEADRIAKTLKDSAAADAQKSEDEIKKLRESTEKNAFGMLTPEQQADAVFRRLAQSFDMDIASAGDIAKGLQALKDQADAARAAGDDQGEKEALEKLQRAQEDVKSLGSGGSNSSSPATLIGETASAFNLLLGRGGNDLVLSENKEQTGLLRQIQARLEAIEKQGVPEDDFGQGW